MYSFKKLKKNTQIVVKTHEYNLVLNKKIL